MSFDNTSDFGHASSNVLLNSVEPERAAANLDARYDYSDGAPASGRDKPSTEGFRSSQTLQRGLDILEIVGRRGPIGLRELTEAVGLTRSTTQRLAAALIERDLIRYGARGYGLGPTLLSLAETARLQRPLTAVARPHLEALAREHRDAVNLAIRDADRVRYLDQVRGERRMLVRSVIGETRSMATTALGRALLLDATESVWRKTYEDDPDTPGGANALFNWVASMRQFRQQGAAFDIEESGDQVRCVAAPIRDASGRIVGAISLSSLPQYLDEARMRELVTPVVETADNIAADLGWVRRIAV